MISRHLTDFGHFVPYATAVGPPGATLSYIHQIGQHVANDTLTLVSDTGSTLPERERHHRHICNGTI